MTIFSEFRWFLATAIAMAVVSASAVTFTTDTTIDTGNTNYEGQAIIVSGCTLTVNGTHSFASVEAISGGVLTHQATTTNQTHSLQLAITGALVVDATSKIDISALGYLPGYTLSNTTVGGAVYLAGGSYGGAGFSYTGGGTGNVVYGDYRNPDELGSGSGNYSTGGSGGGLVRITASSAQLNGAILANGGNSYDGGSGGGIYLNVGTLSGTGTIAANGGSASGNNGGGGGRVAVYYASDSGFNLTNNINALGGLGPSGSGSAGTVYLQQSGQLGELLINNNGAKNSAWTPLGVATNTVFLVDNLVITGTNTVAATASGAPIRANSVTVVDGAVLTQQPTTTNQTYSLQLTITNNLVLDATSEINVTALGYLKGYTQGNTTNGGATYLAGGSYGGSGNSFPGSIANAVYGDYRNPDDLGSGSGPYAQSGSGGGLVRITAGNAEIDGKILANGENNYNGGSGGGIYLNVGTLNGTGTITANGGSASGNNGGGGGRVAVYFASDSGFNLTNNVAAVGGAGPSGAGSAGTVYLQQIGQLGLLLINNSGAGTGSWTPLGVTTDAVFLVDNLVITGTNTVAATASGAPIQANSVSLANGAILTHQAATTNQVYSLEMTVTNNLVVDAVSAINVTGMGYLPGYTVGNTTNGAATFTAGGSYGGVGFICCGSTVNAVYGDYLNPNELGSGSGTYSGGAAGGGLVRITTGSAQINGGILANGGNNYDGGSGGGIYLNVGTLSGTGTITANGGSGNANDGGGGGRVAIYYTSANGFNLTNNVSAIGGAAPFGAGSAGTVYLQQSGQLGQLIINNNGAGAGGLTPLGTSTDTVFQVDNLIVTGSNTIAATVAGAPIQANSATIMNGGTLTQQATTIQNTYSLQLTIANNLLIDPTSAINVSGMGYLPGYTQGNTTGGAASFTAGGSYGGLGAICCGSTANAVYGDYHNPDDLGSGSGTYNRAASGGGLVRITASSAQVNGAILANGGNGYDGGSGGGILVNVGVLNGTGTIAANGGNADGNDGGGGGRVAIYAWAAQNMPPTNIIANGGTGPSGNGQNGSAYIATSPFFIWGNSPELWHGTEPISWQALGGNPGSQVEVSITRNGIVYLNQNGSVGPGFINWDTTTVTDGVYVITANFVNGSGQAIGQLWQQAVVNNAATYHSGLIATNETWSAASVNVVDGNVIIPNGVTVTVAPGAVVKVARGFQIIVQTGGTFDTIGATSADPIVFTSLDDNSVGGDTLEGVQSSTPQPGEWSGIVTEGGQFLQNQFVDLRYALFNLGGTLTANQTLLGSYLYVVTNPIIIASNVTLRITPGTVVKFDTGMNITVQPGGNLIARGTVAEPITFTSIKDSSVGGNQGGGASPAAGDWDSIYISGGTADFDHVVASYGASQNLPAGLITSTDPASVVSIANSIIEQGLYDGIQGAAGTVTITNCVVTGCDRGIQAGLQGAALVTIVNCTLDNNNYGIFFHGGIASVANTIVANSVQAGIADCCGSAVTTFEYNDVWAPNGINYNNTTWPYPDPTGTDGNISVNPNFIDEGNGDYQLNYLSPCIDAADSLVALPTDLMGDPRYNDPRTLTKTGVASASGLYADIGAYEFVESAPSTVDLVPTAINGPTSVTPGDQVAVTWTVANKGSGPATGPWHDTLSLFSADGSSNVIAVATELVQQDAILGAGQSYTKSVVVRVPSGAEGNYLWQVHANSGDEIFEGQNITNNVLNASVATSLTLPTLPVGGTLTSSYTATGQGDLYKISPGAAQNLVVTLQDNAPGTVLELYLAQGHAPTVSQFDYKSSQFNTNVVSLTVPNTVGGDYYILAYARSLNSPDVTYTISASIVTQFGVSVVSPGEITDNGPVTLQLNGGQLAGNDTYQLVGPGGTFSATNVVGSNPNDSFVTFNLGGAATGNYSLVITQPGGQSITNLNVVRVTNSIALPQFSVQLQVPTIYRVGRDFSGLISYGNVGNADMPSPLLILTSGGIAGLQLLPTDSYSSNDLVLVAAAMDGPAGVLRPGQTYSIPFSAQPYLDATIPFQVDYKSSDSTDTVDYASLALEVRPPGYSDDDWNVAWNGFKAAAGPTWGGFVQLVDNYATTMAQNPGSGTFYSLQDVLAYAFADRVEQLETSIAGTLYLGDTNHPLSQTFMTVSDTNNDTGVAQSLADGTFSVLSLTNGIYSVGVPGYWQPTPLSITVPKIGEVTNVNIIVQQGATIRGVVYDQFGVLFLTNVDVEVSSTTTNSVFDTFSGADGAYVLSGLPPDSYTVTAGTGSYSIQQIPAQSVSNNQTWNTNFFLFAGATVKGQVFASSEAFVNAIASFTDTNGNVTTALSGTNGVFDIGGLGAGMWNIQIQGNNLAPYATNVNLLPGENLNLGSITLQPPANIIVLLDYPTNQSVNQAELELYQNGNLLSFESVDSNGVASFNDLAAGMYQVVGTVDGYLNLSNNVAVSGGATVTNTVDFRTLATINGRVTDAGGSPVTGLAVNITGLSNNQSIAFGALTDTNGDYILTGLTAGPYVMSVGNEGGILDRRVTVSDSLGAQTVNFILPDTVIDGGVLNSGGVTPLPGATVLLSQGDQLVATAATDTNGLYRFRVVVPGTYILSSGFVGIGLTTNQSIVVPANTNLAAAPLTIGTLQFSGRVQAVSGEPLPGALVILFLNNGQSAVANFNATTTSDGRFLITGLIPGTYALQIRISGYATVMEPITIAGNTSQSFVLPTGAVAQGTITDADTGEIITNAAVSLIDPATKLPVVIIATDASGNYSLSNLALTSYDVVVADPTHQIRELVNTSLNTNPFTLNVSLAKAKTSLSGTITDTGANPIPGANVSVVESRSGETLFDGLTATNGTWSTSQLPPGNYAFGVVALGYLPPPTTNIVVVASIPQIINTVVTPAATDDNPFLFPQFFEDYSRGIGYSMFQKVGLESPEQLPDVPAPDTSACPCAYAAFDAYIAAERKKNLWFTIWSDTYFNGATAVGSTFGGVIPAFLRLGADVLGAASGYGEAVDAETAVEGEVNLTVNALRDQNTLAQGIATFAAKGLTVGGDALTAVTTFTQKNAEILGRMSLSSPSSIGEGILAMTGTFTDFGATGITLEETENLVKALNGGTSVFKVGSKEEIGIDSAVLALGLFETYLQYKEAKENIEKAEQNYKAAYQTYLNAVQALIDANNNCNNCPPPTPPTPPTPPNPTPGPTNPSKPGGANDPNDKLTTGTGLSGFVRPGASILYTVLFENEPTATLPAQEVVITDQLDSRLDYSTVQLGTIGFNNVTIQVPPGVQTFSTNVFVATDPNPVQVNGSLNITNGLLTWVIQSIDPLTGQPTTDPLAGFLPPDNTNGVGEGYVTYSVSSQTNVSNGSIILNQADIVFDANAPILTPVTTNTIDSAPPQSSVLSLPTSATNTQFLVQWSGNDSGGSGVASYNVYVSTNNGDFSLWFFNTTNTSAIFTGKLFNKYSFYSVAVDEVGNVQATPTAAQATTIVADVITLAASIPNALGVINGEVVVAAGGTNTFLATGQDQYNLPLTYQWSFGDGTSTGILTTNSVTHSYGDVSGTYLVSVTASNGYIGVTKELTVLAALPLTIAKATVDPNFAAVNADSVSLTAILDLQNLTTVAQLANMRLVLDIGGAQVAFTLNNKGTATSANGTCKLVYSSATKTVPGFWTLTATLSHGEWHNEWSTYGLFNATIAKPGITVTLPIVVSIGNQTFAAEQPLDYTATVNKTGSATRDLTKPTLSIKTPTTGQRVATEMFTVTGKAADLVAVESVFYNLNNTGWYPADTMNKWAAWTAPVTLTPGTNTILAYAVDTSGNISPTNTVKFTYVVSAELTVRTNGGGTIAPHYNDALLQVGTSYSMTASPKTGWKFVNWTDVAGDVITSSATLKFVMASNLTFVANFLDVAKPTLSITAPPNLQKTTNTQAEFKGVAKDNWQVDAVWYQLNGGAWTKPSTSDGWTNWNVTLPLVLGTNVFNAYAVDFAGNFSITNEVRVISSEAVRMELAIPNLIPLKDEGFEFSLQLSVGASGHIEFSTNLTSWEMLTNFVGTDSTITFRDPAATNSSHRYYRAVVP
jgi:hypothetical protein